MWIAENQTGAKAAIESTPNHQESNQMYQADRSGGDNKALTRGL